MTDLTKITEKDLAFMRRAIEIAHETEEKGNSAVGCVIVLDGEIIAEGGNEMVNPDYHPGHHAETVAISRVPLELWSRSNEMTLYTTLEPCVMCMGVILCHGFGRTVYASKDDMAGGVVLLPELPPYWEGGRGVPVVAGPCLEEECDPLRERCHEVIAKLPLVTNMG